MWIILLIVLLALAGGFLGSLLEFAFWLVVVTALVFAVLGFLAYRGLSSGRTQR
jgi:hypothetical protein